MEKIRFSNAIKSIDVDATWQKIESLRKNRELRHSLPKEEYEKIISFFRGKEPLYASIRTDEGRKYLWINS